MPILYSELMNSIVAQMLQNNKDYESSDRKEKFV